MIQGYPGLFNGKVHDVGGVASRTAGAAVCAAGRGGDRDRELVRGQVGGCLVCAVPLHDCVGAKAASSRDTCFSVLLTTLFATSS